MTDLSTLRFFTTPSHQCSYLEGEIASTLFADPHVQPDTTLYSQLGAMGFRRSGDYLYRPNCAHCQQCVSVRIDTWRYPFSRNEKRILKQNADLEVTLEPASLNKEHYDLYKRYIVERHVDGDMFPPSEDQFRNFLLSDWAKTTFASFRLDGRLIASAAFDEMNEGLSAVYTYYDPAYDYRSLGTLAILWQIHHCQSMSHRWLYLGYWIESCRKMAYKARFHQLQRYTEKRWLPFARG